MEFVKAYDATKYFSNLAGLKKVYGVDEIYKHGYYIANDTNDFQVYRIQVGINSQYEAEEDTKIIEWDKISKYEFIDFIEENEIIDEDKLGKMKKIAENTHSDNNQMIKYLTNLVFAELPLETVISIIINIDADKGFENWDSKEFRYNTDLKELVDVISNGSDIIPFMEEPTEDGLKVFN